MSAQAAAEEARALAAVSPGGLALTVDRTFRYPPHIELIDRAVVDAVADADRELASGEWTGPRILLVAVPPRHGKSTLISEHTPAWFLGRYPDRRVILASYQAEFAATWGWKARNLLEEHGRRLYGVGVDPSSRSAKRWQLHRRKGGMLTAGVGGPITGQGAHLLIVDDPVKNAEEAMSEVIREKQKDWWRSTVRTRLEPGAVVVVLMTRWHHDDLGGFLLAQAGDGGDPVTELRLPAIAEDQDPLGRDPGDALWPDRYPADALDQLRRSLGPYWFAAMFQGTPTPDEGGIFNRRDFRYFTLDPTSRLVTLHRPDGSTQAYGLDWLRKFQAADLAISEKETADYTVLGDVWVTPDGDMLIASVTRDRIPGPDQPDFFEAHHAGTPIKVEAIGYQTSLVQKLRRRGLPVEPVYPDKDKVTRAAAAGVLYRQGKVYHRKGAEWLADFELELLAFPAGEHDDQVDMVAYAARAVPDALKVQARPDPDRPQARTHMGGTMDDAF